MLAHTRIAALRERHRLGGERRSRIGVRRAVERDRDRRHRAGVAEARDDQSADPRLEPAFPAERRVAASLPGEAAANDAVDVLVAEDAADEMLPQHRLVAVT